MHTGGPRELHVTVHADAHAVDDQGVRSRLALRDGGWYALTISVEEPGRDGIERPPERTSSPRRCARRTGGRTATCAGSGCRGGSRAG